MLRHSVAIKTLPLPTFHRIPEALRENAKWQNLMSLVVVGARYQIEEMKMLNIYFLPVEIELTTCRYYSSTLVPLRSAPSL